MASHSESHVLVAWMEGRGISAALSRAYTKALATESITTPADVEGAPNSVLEGLGVMRGHIDKLRGPVSHPAPASSSPAPTQRTKAQQGTTEGGHKPNPKRSAPFKTSEGPLKIPKLVASGVEGQTRIRRFDVFAEFKRQELVDKGKSEDVAKGEAVWLAKVVAGGRGGGKRNSGAKGSDGTSGEGHQERFKSLAGQPQTDEVFDRDVVSKVGLEVYNSLLKPGIEAARLQGLQYDDLRGPSGVSKIANQARIDILMNLLAK